MNLLGPKHFTTLYNNHYYGIVKHRVGWVDVCRRALGHRRTGAGRRARWQPPPLPPSLLASLPPSAFTPPTARALAHTMRALGLLSDLLRLTPRRQISSAAKGGRRARGRRACKGSDYSPAPVLDSCVFNHGVSHSAQSVGEESRRQHSLLAVSRSPPPPTQICRHILTLTPLPGMGLRWVHR
jgi:hypothetical protein